MTRVLATVFGIVLVVIPAPVPAQPTAEPAPAAAPATPPIDATALGISLRRIQQRLTAESKARSSGLSPLRLEYFVDVYGTAPALRFFTGEDLIYGTVPGGAPTHRDMLWHVTPQAFRSPRVDFLGLAAGAAAYGARKVQDWNYERELAAYKKLIEAGRIVPAPQPPRR
jgi:hypothetical protein